MKDPIKVLVVDDSYFMRRVISEILTSDPQVRVIGTASNGADALKIIKSLRPDVVTLDIDMPGMSGMSVIRHIMIQCPIPIVVFSSLFCYGDVTYEALKLGVVDFVPKPSGMVAEDQDHLQTKIIERVKNASCVNIGNIRRVAPRPRLISTAGADHRPAESPEYMITVGAGLSGTNSVMRLVSQLLPTLPGAITAMLEIAPQILPAFVQKFNKHAPWEIRLIEDGQTIHPGVCYIGSTEDTVRVGLDNDNAPTFYLEEKTVAPLNTLFESSAAIFNDNTVGVLLTGLGEDGASGFSRIQICNGITIAQNTDCCVFPNLTQNAIAMGAVTQVVDEDHLPFAIDHYITPGHKKKVA